jgi:hypothetical protein
MSEVEMTNGPKSGDLLGLAPYEEAVKVATSDASGFLRGFLERICYPVAEELGLTFQDKVRAWRFGNLNKVAGRANALLDGRPNAQELRAPPQLVAKIVEAASWIDCEELQDMWAGLLASSCTEEGKDDGNLVFVNLLNQLTSGQARVLKHSCEGSAKGRSQNGWLFANPLYATREELEQITGISDPYRLDRELDCLRALGLIENQGGFQTFSPDPRANIQPSALALYLYAKCRGHAGTPVDFYFPQRA